MGKLSVSESIWGSVFFPDLLMYVIIKTSESLEKKLRLFFLKDLNHGNCVGIFQPRWLRTKNKCGEHQRCCCCALNIMCKFRQWNSSLWGFTFPSCTVLITSLRLFSWELSRGVALRALIVALPLRKYWCQMLLGWELICRTFHRNSFPLSSHTFLTTFYNFLTISCFSLISVPLYFRKHILIVLLYLIVYSLYIILVNCDCCKCAL